MKASIEFKEGAKWAIEQLEELIYENCIKINADIRQRTGVYDDLTALDEAIWLSFHMVRDEVQK